MLPATRVGDLQVRNGGTGDDAILLLHGMISTGDIFGEAFDSLTAKSRFAAPDLLGFGGSIDHERSRFSLDDQLDALDALLDSGLLGSGMITVGAHSMGSTVALAWAQRHPTRIRSLVCWGAPIQPSRTAAIQQLSGSMMASLFALNTDLARKACAVSCRHRLSAGWLAALAEPQLPVTIARAVPLHTWPAYRDSIDELVLNVDWRSLFDKATTHGIPLQLVWGDMDSVQDMPYVEDLVEYAPNATLEIIAGADHRLPLTHPLECVGHLGVAS